MAANASSRGVVGVPQLGCAAAEGCPHLRALARIEEIAGFPHAARSYAVAAAQRRSACCCAAHRTATGDDMTPPSAVALEVRREVRSGNDGRQSQDATLV